MLVPIADSPANGHEQIILCGSTEVKLPKESPESSLRGYWRKPVGATNTTCQHYDLATSVQSQQNYSEWAPRRAADSNRSGLMGHSPT